MSAGNGSIGGRPEALMPPATAARLEVALREFVDRRLSGYVTVVFHFQQGRAMPSELGIHEKSVGETGPPDALFTVRR